MASQLYNKIRLGFRRWLLRRLPTCKSLAPLMSESLERPLSLRERVVLRLHLWVCIWCVWYLQHLHIMRDALRKRAATPVDEASASVAPAVSLSVEARERIKRALETPNQ